MNASYLNAFANSAIRVHYSSLEEYNDFGSVATAQQIYDSCLQLARLYGKAVSQIGDSGRRQH
jgi:hypothetical protein